MYHYLNIYQFYLLNTYRHHTDIHFYVIVQYKYIWFVHKVVFDMYHYVDNLNLNIDHFHIIDHCNHNDIDSQL